METRDEIVATFQTPELSRSDRVLRATGLGGVALFGAFKHAYREARLDESKAFPNTAEVQAEAYLENNVFSDNAIYARLLQRQYDDAEASDTLNSTDLKHKLGIAIDKRKQENHKIANGRKSLTEIRGKSDKPLFTGGKFLF